MRRPLPPAASSASTVACSASVISGSIATIDALQRDANVPSGS